MSLSISGFLFLMSLGGLLMLVSDLFVQPLCYTVEWFLPCGGDLSLSSICLRFDYLGLLFWTTVNIISSSVFLFNLWYMEKESSFLTGYFPGLLLSFVASMWMLIFCWEFPGVLVGWDGLGLSSFFLVIYYQNSSSLAGGLLTGLANRVGDCFILMSISFYYSGLSSSTFAVLMIVAGMTKSAQFPFMSWLPAAMAAPTPVSTLVHSSTLVTAGFYLWFRWFSPLMVDGESLYMEMKLLLILSMFTILLSSMAAVMETDLKKVVALSTLSQIGLMSFALSLFLPFLGFFHLLTHAFLKALLFLSAGVVIHEMGTQDIRHMGGYFKRSPLVSAFMTLSLFSLMGLFFLSGGYSKEAIYLGLLAGSFPGGLSFILLLSFMISVLLTTLYSVRLVLTVLTEVTRAPTPSAGALTTVPSAGVMVSMGVLSFFASGAGSLLSTSSELNNLTMVSSLEVPTALNLAPFMMVVAGVLSVFMVKSSSYTSESSLDSLNSRFFSTLGFLKGLSTQLPSLAFLKDSPLLAKTFDSGWLEEIPQNSLIWRASDYLVTYNTYNLWFVMVTSILALVVVVMC